MCDLYSYFKNYILLAKFEQLRSIGKPNISKTQVLEKGIAIFLYIYQNVDIVKLELRVQEYECPIFKP